MVQSSQVYKIPVEGLGLDQPVHIALRCFSPVSAPRALLYCLPGGACTGRYFDLDIPGDSSYSFAKTMADKGYLVVTVDHLGLGDSTQIDDGFEVTTSRIVKANANALAGLPKPWRQLPQICVGHSMGAMLGICQQAWYGGFNAMALLGFGHCGMPDFLCGLGKELASTPAQALEKDVELAKAQFGQGYFDLGMDAETRPSDSPAIRLALLNKQAPLLTVPGSLTLIPNVIWDVSRQVVLPTFTAMGDGDICGEQSEQTNLVYGKSHSIVLKDTRHNHFLFDSRHQLFIELDRWLKKLM